jgi:cytochrome P450
MTTPPIVPSPPTDPTLGLPWDVEVADPVAALAEARARLGDTFVVDSGGDRYLFTFSPTGVASLYGLPEEQASKGVADWRMLRRKLPDEIFDGRRTLPHQLFGRDDVATYLARVDRSLDATVAELGPTGTFDVFELSRRLGHRVGLASWGGPGAADGDRFDRLVDAFDTLDGSDAFVHPDAMAQVAATDKAAERQALEVVVAEVGDALAELPGVDEEHALFARVARAWDGEPEPVRVRGVALDVALLHVASMSNLFAALGWAVVDLLDHPVEAARVGDGDRARAEQCALESIRMAQRSIMSRYVLAPVTLDVGDGARFEIPAGVTVATLLPLTNTTAAPGLDHWDPDRWHRRRLSPVPGPAAESVTTFGHGRHTCPAQPFSLAAMTIAATRLLGAFELDPGWTERPRPVPAQIGGVARAAGPCPVSYSAIAGR